MGFIQLIKHHVFGYGTFDSPYKDWYLRRLAHKAPTRDWRGIWTNGAPRPWVGRDARLVSDAEFREIIKQNPGPGIPDFLDELRAALAAPKTPRS